LTSCDDCKSKNCPTAAAFFVQLALLLAFLLLMTPILAACGEDPVIGGIDDTASVVLMRYESQEAGVEGVVYRKINRFSAFLGESKLPVLVVFYSSLAPVNSQVIPRLEQMADDYRSQLLIVWIDAGDEPALAEQFKAETLPQFTVVIEATSKRTLIGYDDEGAAKLAKLLEPYLIEP
jgi:thiol-disulfide isomerase/thioredoxin